MRLNPSYGGAIIFAAPVNFAHPTGYA